MLFRSAQWHIGSSGNGADGSGNGGGDRLAATILRAGADDVARSQAWWEEMVLRGYGAWRG